LKCITYSIVLVIYTLTRPPHVSWPGYHIIIYT